jgi:AcrR family transcriptional regulator
MNDIIVINNPQPSRADAVKNRELLMQTARRLFAEQGAEAVPMSAIAEAAQVGKGTLYRHFENKAALCHALLDCEQRDLQERTLHRLRENGDPLDNLRWFLEQVVTFVWDNASLLCVGAGDGNVLLLEHPAHAWWRQTIHMQLRQLQPLGDVDYMSDVLYVMLDAHIIWFQHKDLGYDKTRILDGLIGVLLKFVA